MSVRTMTIGAAAATCIGLSTIPAFAHPVLNSTSPAADAAAVSESPKKTSDIDPKEIRLIFSESIVAKFSGVEVKDKDGKGVDTSAAATDPLDSKQLVVPLSTRLSAGKYTVIWHAVSEDTHRVKGQYSFTVAQ